MVIIYKYKMSVYNDDGVLIGERVARFESGQLVYIVKQKCRKIIIFQTRINHISILNARYLSNPLEYLYRYHIDGVRKVYWDDSKDIFDNKEDAYEYAEQLDKRRNIKFKKVWEI